MAKLYAIAETLSDFKRYISLGLPIVQYRNKLADLDGLKFESSDSRLILNDDYQAAVRGGFWGVHLGQSDLDQLPEDIKAKLKRDRVNLGTREIKLGISTHNEEERLRALNYHPDYLAFGPIFATSSKQLNFAAQGQELLERYLDRAELAVVAIGGIRPDNSEGLLKSGVSALAAIAVLKTLSDQQIICWNRECLKYRTRYEIE